MNDEFFVIDSNNINSVNQSFCGYAIVDNQVVFDISDLDKLTGVGAYIFIQVDDTEIKIVQDYVGSFGIYYYIDEDYFALSNSFLKLMEYLKANQRYFSLNRQYADYYLGTKTAVNTFSNTLINEIEMLGSDIEIVIRKEDKSISFNKIDYDEKTVDIRSKEALNLLDEWFYKWVDIIRNIRLKTNSLSIDLSGGFDTRIVSVLWLSANMDLSNIRINSGRSENFMEDYRIASKIANDFNIKLNNLLKTPKNQISLENFFNRTPYIMFGFNKQMFGFSTQHTKPYFRVSGHCGGTIRDHMDLTPDEYIQKMKKMANYLSPELVMSTEEILNIEFDKLVDIFAIEDIESKSLPLMLYNISRNRHHFGKEFANGYLFNLITIAPLSDPILQKINYQIGIDDNLLLVSLIYLRYCPALLKYEFDSNRHIPGRTIEEAGKINEISPFKERKYNFIQGPDVENVVNDKFIPNPIFKKYEDIFNSKQFEMEFEKYYSRELYNTIRLNLRKSRNRKYDIYSAVEIIKTINDVKKVNHKNRVFIDWIEDFNVDYSSDEKKIRSDSLIEKYATSRLDIKNFGDKNNSIEIVSCSNPYSKIEFPKWFDTDKGKGCVITTKYNDIDLKIRTIGDGELSLKLKSILNLDKNANKFPIYIDYISLTVDGKEILDENQLTSHDSPFEFKMQVKNKQIIDVHVEWLPFNKNSSYNNNEVELLEEKLKHLKAENKKLKSAVDKISNSKIEKILSKLKGN